MVIFREAREIGVERQQTMADALRQHFDYTLHATKLSL